MIPEPQHRALLDVIHPKFHESLRQLMATNMTRAGFIWQLRRRGWLTQFQADCFWRGFGATLVIAGRYVIEARLGNGGMGVVYRARDKRLPRRVALKFLRLPAGISREKRRRFLERFTREASMQSQTAPHPHLACLYDAETSGQQRFLVLEWVDGPNLAACVRESGPLPWWTACRFACDICSALQHMIRLGILHRDVKPSNVVLTPEGICKLIDLGIARRIDSGTGSRPEEPLTPNGTSVGTPGFMSPEAFVSVDLIDARSDVFCIGAVLYFLLTGREPFAGNRAADVWHNNAQALLPSFQGIHRPLRQVLKRAMSHDPRLRYAGPRELAGALLKLRDRRRHGYSRPPFLLLVASLAILLLTLMAYWL